jgi:phosphomevalonate kinase
VTPAHARVIEIARRHGGAAKPSGAGGGDLAVAFFPRGGGRAEAAREARDAGLVPIDLPMDPRGVRIE